jgi:multiple sugar transport system ATP-binding protein
VLVGPSGCGKSTVLRLIAGLEQPTQGDLYLDAQRVNDIAPKDRDIAMVFQSYALYPHMTVWDNMAFGLKMRKTPKAEMARRVAEAARMLDLDALLQRKPGQLSGGQRQRVALGRAIVRNPKVFLMDEPLSNLDAKLRVQMRSELVGLHRRLQATTLYVTHDQVEAMTMGDMIVVLHQGRTQQVAPPHVVYHQPANMFVGSFMGQMSFLPVRLVGSQLQLDEATGWPVPEHVCAALRQAVPLASNPDASFTLGIRPEHWQLASACPDTPPVLLGCPGQIEPLGPETLVHLPLGEGLASVLARLPGDCPVSLSEPLALTLDWHRVCWFDAQTQARLALAPDG